MAHGKVSSSNFIAPWWLRNRHSQTLWPRLFPAQSSLSYTKERLELKDGDFVDLCWTPENSGPLIAIFHGLEGSIDSPYVQDIMSSITARGWRGVFMHFRGCSGEFNRLNRNYHSGDTEDISFFISTLRQRHPDKPLFAVAYSLGGNALLKYLGEKQSSCETECSDRHLRAFFSLMLAHISLTGASQNSISAISSPACTKKTREKYRNKKINLPLSRLDSLNTFPSF